MLDQRLAEIVSAVFKVPLGNLSPQTSLGAIEPWDSLGHLQLILEVEQTFGVRFATDKISQLRSLQDIQLELESLGRLSQLGEKNSKPEINIAQDRSVKIDAALYELDDGNLSRSDFLNTLAKVGIKAGDVVFVHSDISSFGRMAAGSNNHLADAIIEVFEEAVGDDGLIIMPTFSYSFCRNEIYDPSATPSTVGILTEAFRQRPGVVRTVHPIFSVAVWGKDKYSFVEDLGKDSFDRQSVFGKLHRRDGKILFFGADFQTCTFLHYIEQAHGVPYRYMKSFHGTIRDSGKEHEDSYTYLVRSMDGNVETDTARLEEYLLGRNLMREVALGGGRILMIKAEVLFNNVNRLLDEDIRYLLGGDSR